MSKKANPAMIGVFVVGAVLLLVFAILLFGSQTYFKKSYDFIMYFEESVNGLEEGAPVKFKGVDVGEVKDIMILFEDKSGNAYVPVVIELHAPESPGEDGETLELQDKAEYERHIANGLRASLDFQSYLTGKLYIELDYHPEDIRPMFSKVKSGYREIPTVASDLGEIWTKAADVLNQVSKIDFKSIGEDIAKVARVLGDGLGEVDLKEMNDSFVSAMDGLKDLTDRVGGHVDPVVEDFRVAMEEARVAFRSLEGAAGSVEGVLSEDSAVGGQLNAMMHEVEGAARSVRDLADYLERNPNALLGGRKAPR